LDRTEGTLYVTTYPVVETSRAVCPELSETCYKPNPGRLMSVSVPTTVSDTAKATSAYFGCFFPTGG
jgi:hypothetical protein